MKTEKEWSAWRHQICRPVDVINLNAGTCSPLPKPVLAEVTRFRQDLANDPVQFIWRTAPAAIEPCRKQLADYLGCSSEKLLLFSNTTYGINTVLRALEESGHFSDAGEILMSDQEYYHLQTLWKRFLQKSKMRIKKVSLPLADEKPDLSPEDIVQLFSRSMSSKTKILYFSHGTSTTGLMLPAAELCKLARKHNLISIVDGAHAPGQISLNLSKIDADFYAGNIHKWLMGVISSAFLYVGDEGRKWLQPLVTTASWDYPQDAENENTGFGPSRWTYSHEYQGTRDLAPLLAIDSVLQFRTAIGDGEIYSRMQQLAATCREIMSALDLPVISHDHPDLASSMVACRCPTIDPIKAWKWFRDEKNIELAFPFLDDGTPVLRVSNAWFNSPDDLDRLTEVLKTEPWRNLA